MQVVARALLALMGWSVATAASPFSMLTMRPSMGWPMHMAMSAPDRKDLTLSPSSMRTLDARPQ